MVVHSKYLNPTNIPSSNLCITNLSLIVVNLEIGLPEIKDNSAQFQVKLPTGAELGNICKYAICLRRQNGGVLAYPPYHGIRQIPPYTVGSTIFSRGPKNSAD